MTPSPAQLPPASVAARPAAGAAGDAASQAEGAFAVLLAGVLPMPVIAAMSGQSPRGASEAPPSTGVSAPRNAVAAPAGLGPTPGAPAALADGASAATSGQGPAPAAAPAAVSQQSEPAPAPRGGAVLAPAAQGREPTPPAGWSGAPAQRPAASGPPGRADLLPDRAPPSGPPAPGPLAAPGAASGLADPARAAPELTVALQAHAAAIAARPPTPGPAVTTMPTTADPAAGGPSLASAPAGAVAPERNPTTPAPDSGRPAPAARFMLAPAPEAPGPAAGDPERAPPAELGDAVPGRPGRAANEAASPASRPLPPPPVVQLGIQIAGAASGRVERMVVQLEPAALGRVEVRLEFSHDNRVSALIAADRSDTLELLQRDSRALERSLQDAGLRLDANALSFSLRQEQRGHERGTGMHGTAPQLAVAGAADDAGRRDDARPAHWIGAHRVLDIRI